MSPYNAVFLLLLSCSAIYADVFPNNPGPPPHHQPPPGNYPVPGPPPHHQPPPGNYPVPVPPPHWPPSRVKPGVCQPPSPECRFIRPKGQCKDDGDCERNLKCCTTYCFPQCLPPMPERPVRPQPLKPGVCQPPSPECRFIRPKGQCKDDGDCERNLKCCTTYCFPQCLPPMPERPGRPQPPFRENGCPRVTNDRCHTPWLESECKTDRDCKRNEKCCQTPCNKVCL
ncbi:uncharacterized protein [Aquarana catesbeiana]|uniref:uncharacterized protein n=1 Tax=Aquarana catesbeiana TaxID=8400 RepID=UPI003CC9CA7E